MKTKQIIVGLCLWACVFAVQAGDCWPVAMHQPDSARDTLMYYMGASAVVSSGSHSPFWIQAHHHGDISDAPFSGNLSAGIYKRATRPNRWYDYDFGIVLTGRFDTRRSTGYFNELYAHARLYIVDITAGIQPIVAGSQNPSLSMGGLLFSGNAQPVPRISIGIDQYIPFPGLFGYMEIKGGMTHGWFVDNSRLDPTGTRDALLHYKFIGLRFGGRLPVNIGYEFHHAAQWGGTSPHIGTHSTSWESFKHVFVAGAGGITLSDQLNAEGNHLGFQELALTAKWSGWRITAYWQTLFEDMSAKFIGFTNQTDGLWGLSVRQSQWPFLHSFTYEFLNTTGQDGPWHDKDGLVYGGRSDYYNNSAYRQGWTHFGRILGNPFIQTDNNRVRVHLVGVAGDIYGFQYRLIASYARNWGTYRAPQTSHNTALLVELTKHVEKAWGLDFGIRLAADIGNQYGNTFGGQITISKHGIITNW